MEFLLEKKIKILILGRKKHLNYLIILKLINQSFNFNDNQLDSESLLEIVKKIE